jgi:2-polyprenyl-6-methoxyphenol hydroxylase-like FAD-dependent oxidoreductase
MESAPVVIVGGGPGGLTLAIELGRRGVPCVVFNDKPGTATLPAANATQARTMEHFRRLGFAQELRVLGMPADYPTDITYFTRYSRHELARFKLPPSGAAAQVARQASGSWSTPELPHRCSQLYIEQVLFKHAKALPGVSLRYGWRVVSFEDDGKGVNVTAERVGGTERVTVRGSYLVGVDGARSMVRESLGLELEGERKVSRNFVGGRMIALYIRAPELYKKIAGPPAWMYWAVNGERRSFMTAIDGVETFAFHTQLKVDEERRDISDEEAKGFFEQSLGCACDIEIMGKSQWNAGYTLVANAYKRGRVILAGDAVHLFTPMGGLGYNTAVDDVVNLGWKLAAVVKGWGGEGLLDSYETERRPLAIRNTRIARGYADSVGLFIPPANIEDVTPEGEKSRAEAGAYLNDHARREFNIPGVTFGTRYDGSPVIVPDGKMPPPDNANVYVPSAVPGGRAPHWWLEGERSLYDSFGFEFTLLQMHEGAAAGSGAFEAAATALGVPLTVLRLADPGLRDLYEADLALIRPDQHVAWRGGASALDAAAVLRAATART